MTLLDGNNDKMVWNIPRFHSEVECIMRYLVQKLLVKHCS